MKISIQLLFLLFLIMCGDSFEYTYYDDGSVKTKSTPAGPGVYCVGRGE